MSEPTSEMLVFAAGEHGGHYEYRPTEDYAPESDSCDLCGSPITTDEERRYFEGVYVFPGRVQPNRVYDERPFADRTYTANHQQRIRGHFLVRH